MNKFKSKNFINKLSIVMVLYILMFIVYTIVYLNFKSSPFKVSSTDNIEYWGGEINSCLKINKCPLKTDRKKIILIGDSHAMQLYFGLVEKAYFFDTILLSAELFHGGGGLQNKKIELNRILDYISTSINKDDIVIFTLAQHHLFAGIRSNSDRIEALINIMNSLNDAVKYRGGEFYLFNDTPRLSVNLPMSICYTQLLKYYRTDCDIDVTDSLNYRLPLTNTLTKFAVDNRVKLFDPFYIVCPENTCKPFLYGYQMYMDQNHISKHASIMIANEFVKVIRK